MGTRENIIAAARELFWEKGYEATSPRDIQVLSKAGQGSFYHHFPSKKDLALAAINETVEEAIVIFETVFQASAPIQTRLVNYLKLDRNSLRGCKVGRMVWDSAALDDELRAPLNRYFVYIEQRIASELEKSVQIGEIRLNVPANQVALVIISSLLGSYTLSRAEKVSRIEDTVEMMMTFLELFIVEMSN